jgi:hypothetical protein
MKLVKTTPQPQDELESQAIFVADLDKILSGSAMFKLHGVEYFMREVPIETLLKWIVAYNEFIAMQGKVSIIDDELVDKYYEMIKTIVPLMPRSEVKKCNFRQMIALFNTIHKWVVGDIINMDEEKKNRILSQVPMSIRYESMPPRWWQRFVIFMVIGLITSLACHIVSFSRY